MTRYGCGAVITVVIQLILCPVPTGCLSHTCLESRHLSFTSSVEPVDEFEIRNRRKFSKVIYFDGRKINPIKKLSTCLFLDVFDTGNNLTRVECVVKMHMQHIFFSRVDCRPNHIPLYFKVYRYTGLYSKE
jgi:hypothetical protein